MKEVLNNQLEDVNRQIDDIRRLPDDKMFSDRFEEYDWTKISVTNFNSVHSPKVGYHNCLFKSLILTF